MSFRFFFFLIQLLLLFNPHQFVKKVKINSKFSQDVKEGAEEVVAGSEITSSQSPVSSPRPDSPLMFGEFEWSWSGLDGFRQSINDPYNAKAMQPTPSPAPRSPPSPLIFARPPVPQLGTHNPSPPSMHPMQQRAYAEWPRSPSSPVQPLPMFPVTNAQNMQAYHAMMGRTYPLFYYRVYHEPVQNCVDLMQSQSQGQQTHDETEG